MKLSLVISFACLLNIVSISAWKAVTYPPSVVTVLDEAVTGKEAIQYCEERYHRTFARNNMVGKVIGPSDDFKYFGCNTNYMWVASRTTCPYSCTSGGGKCNDSNDILGCIWQCDYVQSGKTTISTSSCSKHKNTCVICRSDEYDEMFE
eukprot:367452_1